MCLPRVESRGSSPAFKRCRCAPTTTLRRALRLRLRGRPASTRGGKGPVRSRACRGRPIRPRHSSCCTSVSHRTVPPPSRTSGSALRTTIGRRSAARPSASTWRRSSSSDAAGRRTGPIGPSSPTRISMTSPRGNVGTSPCSGLRSRSHGCRSRASWGRCARRSTAITTRRIRSTGPSARLLTRTRALGQYAKRAAQRAAAEHDLPAWGSGSNGAKAAATR